MSEQRSIWESAQLSGAKVGRILDKMQVNREEFEKLYKDEKLLKLPPRPTDIEVEAVKNFMNTGDFVQLQKDLDIGNSVTSANSAIRRVTQWRAIDNRKD